MPRRLRAGIVAAAALVVALAAIIVVGGFWPSANVIPSGTPVLRGGVDISPREARRPTGGDAASIDRIPETYVAHVLLEVTAHQAPGGPVLPGEPNAVVPGQNVVVLGGPVGAGGIVWVRVYIPSHSYGGGPADVYAWLPTTVDGAPALGKATEIACPSDPGHLDRLASLDPFRRARCQGAATFTVEGRTGSATLPVGYDVEPEWLGPWGGPELSSISLRPERLLFVDVRLPPGLEQPPEDITIRAHLHVADRAATGCRRDVGDRQLVAEAAEDSVLWCILQLVLERWEPVLGPEGRPFDGQDPQLHRFNPSGACAGVGTGVLTFRVDPTQLDPVWLEAGRAGRRIMVWFSPEFHVAFEPDLVVLDSAGEVVAREGTIMAPDADLLAGHGVCPTTQGVFIG